MAYCAISSPPPISGNLRGCGGIWANSGKFGKFLENSGEFDGIQWGLYGAQYEFFLGDLGTTPGFRDDLPFGVVSGDFGPQKALAQLANLESGASSQ